MTSPAVPATGATAPCAEPPSVHDAVRETVRAYFFVSGPADPGLLPRLIEPVAKLGAVPTRVHASRESGDGTELTEGHRGTRLPARMEDRGFRDVIRRCMPFKNSALPLPPARA